LGVAFEKHDVLRACRVSRYETGVHEPPFEIALKLAKVLRVPAAYFYCYEDGLAELVLAWGQLPKSKHKHLRTLVETALTGSVAD
jgi:transcriptional regulator with XRE-family HTH domain